MSVLSLLEFSYIYNRKNHTIEFEIRGMFRDKELYFSEKDTLIVRV